MATIRKILSAVDFSETSAEATRHAVALARELHAEVLLLHAIHDPAFSYADGSGYLTPALVEQFEVEMKERLRTLADSYRTPDLTLSTRVVRGAPHEAILETARAENADLIVMGTHGRSGLGHFLLGSVAERVVRTSPLPVLTVRTKS
jgi:nucleotide-binding universal stress UspA family protein